MNSLVLDPASLAADLERLIAVASVTGTADESSMQHELADRLQQAGCSVDLWRLDLDQLAADPDFPGMEAPREEAWGLVGELSAGAAVVARSPGHRDGHREGGDGPGDGDGPTVVLNAHVDVVPPGNASLWRSPAFEPIRDAGPDGRDAVFGRGACDMKGGLVAVLATLELLKAEGLPRRGRVLVQCVVGEEDGGLGTFATLRRGHRGDVAIVPEPTSCQIVCANAGALTFRLSVPGKAAHGASRRDGMSAIEALWPIWRAIEALEAERNGDPGPLMAHLDTPYGISIGTVRAGDWASTVPDLLVAEGRLGVRLDEHPDDARAALRRAVARACAGDAWLSRHPATVEFFGGQFASGHTAATEPLVGAVAAAHERLTGAAPSVLGAPYGSDLRLLRAAGVPTVHYGPGSARYAHAVDEHVPLDEIAQTAMVLVDVVRSYCS